MLAIAYRMGIKGLAWKNISMMGITVFLGITGTILLFFGTRVIIDGIIRLGRRKKLHVYNFRQIQEMVIYRSNMAAVCSLLTFVALCLFGTGVAISVTYSQPNTHILDYTFQGSSYDKELNMRTVKSDLSKQNIENRFSKIFEVKTGYPAMSNSLDMSNLLKNIREEGNVKALFDGISWKIFS